MACVDTDDLDSVNNNTMSNNNNSCNVNNNAIVSNLALSRALCISNSGADVPCANSGGDRSVGMLCGASSRSSSFRRTRSSGRSHSRRRRSQGTGRRGSCHHSHQNHKRRDRNFPSALCSMISIVILCTALAEPRWVHIENGHCSLPTGRLLKYLGVFQFFYFGDMVFDDPNINHKTVDPVVVEYRFGPDDNDRMINCVTERAVVIFKIVIALTFLAIFTSLVGFGLDLMGLGQRMFKLLRRSSIFNVFSVLVCVGIILFLYWATVDVISVQHQIPDSDAKVSFDVSFYLIAAAGTCSVIAVACNCLWRRVPDPEPPLARAILDEQFSEDTDSLLPPQLSFHGHDLSPMANLPPPPPYMP